MTGYFHIFLLLLILKIVKPEDISTNVTFAVPLPIQSAVVFNPIDSANDARLLLSNQYENLALQSFILNSTLYTNITLRIFNRTSQNKETSFLLTIEGAWNHVKSSANSYSCSVIYQNATTTLGLIIFDRNQQLFKVVKTIPFSFFTNGTLTLTLARQAIVVSDKCELIAYMNPSTNEMSLYRMSPDWLTIHTVSYPNGWNLQNYSADTLFAVSNDRLYRYNSTTYEIQLLFTFPQSYDRYIIKHNLNRIVVSAARTSLFNNQTIPPTNITDYTVFVFNLIQGQLKVINQFNVSGLLQRTQLNEVMTSPKFTKVAFGYYDQMNNFGLILKHIDYSQNRAVDVDFKELPRFSKTIYGVDRSKELFLSDSFAVVRNGSRYNASDNSSVVVEETYQFINNKVIFLRSRPLINSTGNKELYSFSKTGIDPFFQDRLVVLNIYTTSTSFYSIEEYQYGNLAYVRKIQKQIAPPYLSFVEPIRDLLFVDPRFFFWTYSIHKPSTNVTILNYFILTNAAISHLTNTTLVEGGDWRVLSQNEECMALGSATSYNLYRFNRNTSTFQQANNTNALLSGVNITNETVWTASTDCTRLRVGASLFILSQGGNFVAANNSANFSFMAIDFNLTTSIAADGSFWRFDPNVNGYLQLTALLNSSFPVGSSISTAEDGIIVWGTSNSSAWVQAFSFSNSQTKRFFSYQFSQFSSLPKVYLSSNLSKVMIFGSVTSSNTTEPIYLLDAFFLDFKRRTFRNISVPKEAVKDPKGIYIWLDDIYLYVRQQSTFASSDASGSQVIAREFIYYFAGGSIPLKIFSNQTKPSLNVTWIKSIISHRPDGSFLMTESLEGDASSSRRIVRAQHLNKNYGAYQANGNFAIQIDNGQPKVCSVGCSDCSCSSCLPGYVLDDLTETSCLACALGCATCSAIDKAKCESCLAGTFLNSSSRCQPCDYQCLKCSSSASQCLSCRPGYFFNNASKTCQACPYNCFSCSDAHTCTICMKGFVLAGNICRACYSSCSECYPKNITKCTACGRGLQQMNAVCSSCPSNCLECNNGICAVCTDGYVPDNNGVCITKCQLPCLTCLNNQPAFCTSCFNGAVLNNGICQIDLACNANNSCVDCGQGFNYILIATETGAYCSLCPNISNCIQCSSFDSYVCSICKESFYVSEEGTCAVCSVNCSSCKSDSICNSCTSGYTLATGYTQGLCIKCQAPCITCSGQPTYCTSCNSSTHIRFNSQCRNNIRISFRFVVTEAAVNILDNIDKVVLGLLLLLGESKDNIGAITFDQILSGSTVIVGAAQPSSNNINAAYNSLAKGLPGGIPNTSYQVSESSVTLQGSSSSITNEDIPKEQSSASQNLLLGILIPVGIICIGLVILALMTYKNSHGSETHYQANKGGSGTMISSSDHHGRETPDTISHQILPEDYHKHH